MRERRQYLTARSAQTGCPASRPPTLRGTTGIRPVRSLQSEDSATPALRLENRSCRRCGQSKPPPRPHVHRLPAPREWLLASNRPLSRRPPPPAHVGLAAEKSRAAWSSFRSHRAPQTEPARLRPPGRARRQVLAAPAPLP